MMPYESLADDCDAIRAGSFVERVEFHAEIDSTNNRAIELVGGGALAAPALILADMQSAGRGRGKNAWWSSPGGLTFSLAIPLAWLDLPERRWPQVSLTVAVALCEALRETAPGPQFGVKWPNDVFADGRKIAGILVEVPPASPQSRALVIGVGLNVNNSWAAAPPELQQVGVALCDLTNQHHRRAELLIQLLSMVEAGLIQLRAGQPSLAQTWQALCVLRGRSIKVAMGEKIISGTCQGLDADGALLVKTGADADTVRLFGGVVQSFE